MSPKLGKMTKELIGNIYFSTELWQNVLWENRLDSIALRDIDPMHIAWIKSCQHNHERFRHLARSKKLPLEVMLLIRDHITDGFTLYTFDCTMNIPPCRAMLCNRLLLEKWYETDLDVISIAEWEYNKQYNKPPYTIRHQPTYYLIQETETGFKMMVLKKHPYHRYQLNYPLYVDPIHQNEDYLPCNVYSVFDYDRLGKLFYGTDEHHPLLTAKLKRRYRQIRDWFGNSRRVKKLYPGWDPQNHLNPLKNPYRGKCWIYPVKDASRTLYHQDKPCIQWSQTLFDIYGIQQRIMRIWMNKG